MDIIKNKAKRKTETRKRELLMWKFALKKEKMKPSELIGCCM